MERHPVHELAVMESVVEIVAEHLGDERAAVVRLEVGTLAGVDAEALRFCFDVCTSSTPLAGATLELVAIPARARCRACRGEAPLRAFGDPCSCGSFDLEVVAGTELRLKEVEVA